MPERVHTDRDFWLSVEHLVASKVVPAMGQGEAVRRPLIGYLRELEMEARLTYDRRETIQVIASGRRLLGDRETVGPDAGPFSRT